MSWGNLTLTLTMMSTPSSDPSLDTDADPEGASQSIPDSSALIATLDVQGGAAARGAVLESRLPPRQLLAQDAGSALHGPRVAPVGRLP